MAKPFVEIIEHPATKSLRFRYESESRHGRVLVGEKSCEKNLSFPKIKVHNYTGPITVYVSCVTNDESGVYRQHPHKLLNPRSEQTKKAGYYDVRYEVCPKVIEFKSLTIISMKKEHIKKSLENRRDSNMDPTGGGWDHIHKPKYIDMHSLRLCFQVYGEDVKTKRINIGYAISNKIMDKNTHNSLNIVELSSTTSQAQGGDKIMIFCNRVKREEISIIFYEEEQTVNGIKRTWQRELNYKNCKSLMVHHQYGIRFHTPSYKDSNTMEVHQTFIQLYRETDQEYSNSLRFEFVPNEQTTKSTSIHINGKRRRKKMDDNVTPFLNAFGVSQTKKNDTKLKSTNYVPNVLGNHLIQMNRNNDMMQPKQQPTANEQPLIDFSHVEEKENVYGSYQMQNQLCEHINDVVNRQFETQYGSQFPSNNVAQNPYVRAANNYYLPQIHPFTYENGTFDQQINAQSHTPYIPMNTYQQQQHQHQHHYQQQQQQPHAMNNYGNEYAAGIQHMYPVMNPNINDMPLAYNNLNIPPNYRQVNATMNHNRPPDTTTTDADANVVPNFSDIVQPNTTELYKAAMDIDNLTGIGRLSSNLETQCSIE